MAHFLSRDGSVDPCQCGCEQKDGLLTYMMPDKDVRHYPAISPFSPKDCPDIAGHQRLGAVGAFCVSCRPRIPDRPMFAPLLFPAFTADRASPRRQRTQRQPPIAIDSLRRDSPRPILTLRFASCRLHGAHREVPRRKLRASSGREGTATIADHITQKRAIALIGGHAAIRDSRQTKLEARHRRIPVVGVF